MNGAALWLLWAGLIIDTRSAMVAAPSPVHAWVVSLHEASRSEPAIFALAPTMARRRLASCGEQATQILLQPLCEGIQSPRVQLGGALCYSIPASSHMLWRRTDV